ncbi:hypothetical protein KUCAC02_033030, partial [Chaenocephalus aceratus]
TTDHPATNPAVTAASSGGHTPSQSRLLLRGETHAFTLTAASSGGDTRLHAHAASSGGRHAFTHGFLRGDTRLHAHGCFLRGATHTFTLTAASGGTHAFRSRCFLRGRHTPSAHCCFLRGETHAFTHAASSGGDTRLHAHGCFLRGETHAFTLTAASSGGRHTPSRSLLLPPGETHAFTLTAASSGGRHTPSRSLLLPPGGDTRLHAHCCFLRGRHTPSRSGCFLRGETHAFTLTAASSGGRHTPSRSRLLPPGGDTRLHAHCCFLRGRHTPSRSLLLPPGETDAFTLTAASSGGRQTPSRTRLLPPGETHAFTLTAAPPGATTRLHAHCCFLRGETHAFTLTAASSGGRHTPSRSLLLPPGGDTRLHAHCCFLRGETHAFTLTAASSGGRHTPSRSLLLPPGGDTLSCDQGARWPTGATLHNGFLFLCFDIGIVSECFSEWTCVALSATRITNIDVMKVQWSPADPDVTVQVVPMVVLFIVCNLLFRYHGVWLDGSEGVCRDISIPVLPVLPVHASSPSCSEQKASAYVWINHCRVFHSSCTKTPISSGVSPQDAWTSLGFISTPLIWEGRKRPAGVRRPASTRPTPRPEVHITTSAQPTGLKPTQRRATHAPALNNTTTARVRLTSQPHEETPTQHSRPPPEPVLSPESSPYEDRDDASAAKEPLASSSSLLSSSSALSNRKNKPAAPQWSLLRGRETQTVDEFPSGSAYELPENADAFNLYEFDAAYALDEPATVPPAFIDPNSFNGSDHRGASLPAAHPLSPDSRLMNHLDTRTHISPTPTSALTNTVSWNVFPSPLDVHSSTTLPTPPLPFFSASTSFPNTLTPTQSPPPFWSSTSPLLSSPVLPSSSRRRLSQTDAVGEPAHGPEPDKGGGYLPPRLLSLLSLSTASSSSLPVFSKALSVPQVVDDALLPEDPSSKEATNNTSEAVRSRSPDSESDRTLDTQSGSLVHSVGTFLESSFSRTTSGLYMENIAPRAAVFTSDVPADTSGSSMVVWPSASLSVSSDQRHFSDIYSPEESHQPHMVSTSQTAAVPRASERTLTLLQGHIETLPSLHSASLSLTASSEAAAATLTLSAGERPFLAAQTSSSGSQSKDPSSRPSRGPWRLQHPNTSHSEHNDAFNRPTPPVVFPSVTAQAQHGGTGALTITAAPELASGLDYMHRSTSTHPNTEHPDPDKKQNWLLCRRIGRPLDSTSPLHPDPPRTEQENDNEDFVPPLANRSQSVADQASSPEASSPEASSPEASSPEASSPEASSPEASSPEASPPEASPPEASSPEASSPEASSPEASHNRSLPGKLWHLPTATVSEPPVNAPVVLDPLLASGLNPPSHLPASRSPNVSSVHGPGHGLMSGLEGPTPPGRASHTAGLKNNAMSNATTALTTKDSPIKTALSTTADQATPLKGSADVEESPGSMTGSKQTAGDASTSTKSNVPVSKPGLNPSVSNQHSGGFVQGEGVAPSPPLPAVVTAHRSITTKSSTTLEAVSPSAGLGGGSAAEPAGPCPCKHGFHVTCPCGPSSGNKGLFFKASFQVEGGAGLTQDQLERAVGRWLNQTFQNWTQAVYVDSVSYSCQALLLYYYISNQSVGGAELSNRLSGSVGAMGAGLQLDPASTQVTLIENCPEENPLHYRWPESRPTVTQTLPCFPNKEQSTSRTCLISPQDLSSYWSVADISNCTDIDTIEVSAENAAEVAVQLAVITDNELSEEEVSKVVSKVKQLVCRGEDQHLAGRDPS